jgi:hypothetical protein
MSLLCATACSLMFLVTHDRVWGLVAILCDITVLWNLNPFIRMDGYWLFSDWLGVQNLMTVNREVTWWLVRKAFGRNPALPPVLSSGYRFRAAYAAYYVLFVVFFIYASTRLCVQYLPRLVRAYPDICLNLLDALAQPQASHDAAWQWLFFTLALVGILLLFVRMLSVPVSAAIREMKLSVRRPGAVATEETT